MLAPLLHLGLLQAENSVPQIPENPEHFHIFLLMGQSNMEGGRSVDGDMDKEADARILKLNDWNSWELAVDPLTSHYKVAVGPGMAFAKRMIAENPDITIGLIPLAVGGTKIGQWMRGTPYYAGTLSAVAAARQKGVIKGILWHQGEHDGILPGTAYQYDRNLKLLIDELRVDLGDAHLPFIVGGLVNGIFENKNHAWANEVQDRLIEVGTHFYQTAYVRSGDVPELGDHLHFSTAGQRIMGERYAEAYLGLTGHWLSKWWSDLNSEPEDPTTAVSEQSESEAATGTTVEGETDVNADPQNGTVADNEDEETTQEDPPAEGDETLGDGWIWHEPLGLLYTKNFPLVKQAQLGWLKLDICADGSFLLDSPIFGKFRTFVENPANALYIYRENPNPEHFYEHGDTYYVNLLADSGNPMTFYNHTTETWQNWIDERANLDNVDALNAMTESEFAHTQIDLSFMVTDPGQLLWSEESLYLKDAELHRKWVILYGTETFQFADEKLEGDAKTFWKNQSLHLVDSIDVIFLEAQQRWIEYVNALYPPPAE